MKLIKHTFHISKPICFLCGPYYEEKPYDRRNILRDFIINENRIIPIIVDKFLDRENINDDTINLDLLEEIFATVSFKTYIFLDTFSSVAELGIFSSSAYQNQIDVFLPKNSDIISNNVGYFINEIINNPNNNKINCFYYRPKIVRVPIASEYVTEYYEFTKNELPQNIKDRIKTDDVYSTNNYNLSFRYGNNHKEEFSVVTYSVENSKVDYYISVRMLFYLVASILLHKDDEREIDDKVNEIVIELKEILNNSYLFYEKKEKLEFKDILISTKISHDIRIIIKHILIFIKLYYVYGDSKGRHIITKKDSIIRDFSVFEYFGILSEDELIINEYIKCPDNYIEIIKIKRGKKIRNVTKYKNDEKGNELRLLHKSILNKLQEVYTFSKNSFAYRKGFSILDCVKLHKKSISFLKVDIKNFFNSIKYLEMYNSLKNIIENHCTIDNGFKNLLKVFLYNNMLPLGLITSPILSEIYMHEFDEKIDSCLNSYMKKIVFTRYADDMFFSSEEELDNNDIDYIINLLSDELKKINFQINQDKTISKNMVNVGDHIKLLGVNIIKTQSGNELTVGKKYINDTCKMCMQFWENKIQNKKSKEYEFYTEKRIVGRIAYIKQIEGKIGQMKLKKRIEKSINKEKTVHDDLFGILMSLEQEKALA